MPQVHCEVGLPMRLFCNTCGKCVSNEVPDETTIRAALVCPECIEAGKVTFPEPADKLECSKCKSEDLMCVAGVAAGNGVMIACKKCSNIESRELTPKLKGQIQAKMAPVDAWKDR
jgi:hypothetical protein